MIALTVWIGRFGRSRGVDAQLQPRGSSLERVQASTGHNGRVGAWAVGRYSIVTAIAEAGQESWLLQRAGFPSASEELGLATDSPRIDIPLVDLRPGPSPRAQPLCGAHVDLLVELGGNWPPVVVRRGDLQIIDGHHRVEAARRLGLATISGYFVDGSDDDAYLDAVRLNIRHGLVLTMAERREAARLILSRHPDWADRRVSAICGLSHSTVGEVRRTSPPESQDCPSVGHARLDKRVGRDGRSRPVDSDALRARIAEFVAAAPSASLRSVARVAGASPETVRAVRNDLRLGAPSPSTSEPASAGVPHAFGSTTPGREFFDWFSRTQVGPNDPVVYSADIPLSRVYEVADEARERASRWQAFADLVERRAR
jgi:ParB-like nuclease family protein